MRTYRNTAIFAVIITIISIILAIVFIENKLLFSLASGVFGSGVLTIITSAVAYRVEKRKTFEGVFSSVHRILHQLGIYNNDWELDRKVDYLLIYFDSPSKQDLHQYYGSFCFFTYNKKKTSYIYNNICKPIFDFDEIIKTVSANLRLHQDGTVKNDNAIRKIIETIEEAFVPMVKEQTPEETQVTIPCKKLVDKVREELNGKYYDMMYSKKQQRRISENN